MFFEFFLHFFNIFFYPLNAITPLFRRFPNFVEEFNKLGADLQLIEKTP
jgi:hypothetical protein